MGALITLAAKDVRILARDKFALFWIFAFPTMYALFFGALFGGEGDGARSRMPIAVVDDDGSDASRRLVERLADHASLAVERETPSPTAAAADGAVPATAVSTSRPSADADGGDSATDDRVDSAGAPRVHALEAAREAVRKGRKTAYVRILPGYGGSPFRMFGGGEGEPAIEVGLDPARSAEAGLLQGVLMETVFGGMTESWGDPALVRGEVGRLKAEIGEAADLNPAQKLTLQTFLGALGDFLVTADAQELDEGGPFGAGGAGLDLVEVVDVSRERDAEPRSAFEVTFPSALIWGLMGVAIAFAITIVRERGRGTLLRLRVAPISRTQLLAGKALGCFVTCLFVMVVLLGFAVLALGVRVESPLLALLAMACTAACFTGLMMTAAVIGKTEEAVAGAAWGVMMPFAMIGGGMIPLIAMPPWLLALSDFSPFKWGIYSLEGAVWRGFDLADMLGPCAVLLAIGAVFFTLGVTIFRRLDA